MLQKTYILKDPVKILGEKIKEFSESQKKKKKAKNQ